MRALCVYTAVSAVLLACSCPAATAENQGLIPRQDTQSTTAPVASTPASKASSTPQSTDARSATSTSSSSATANGAAASSSSKQTGALSNSVAGTSQISAAATTFVGIAASPIPKGSLNITSTNDTIVEGLPIQPRITPGLSVAGALLILTGSLYTLIGIKTQWIHVSASSAYLVSLAITVLIVYLMHPPISNGLQGAYVAAIICTGGLLGGLSLLFKDITEGFSTFLGGFCLSMWFLVLKPGGLISNDAGKVIFIALMTVGAFPLYLSHHTRPYGLIGSTSFAGATVIVLGIDCFSRAGLKEFWLYIWKVNEKLFPLQYHQKYPITRGIRVEIAAIIILSLIGVMSQLKVWKIVKQKREERASEQRRKEHQRNLSDEERGRRVEEDNQQDQPLWEALHGGKSQTTVQERYLDSGVGTEEPGSTRKSSWNDVRDSETEGMELQNVRNAPKGANDNGRVTVHVAQDDFYEVSLIGGQRTSLERNILEATPGPSTRAPSETSSVKVKTKVIDPNLTLRPKVVPPPFKIPDLESASDDDGSSVEASAPSDHLPDRGSKRLSAPSLPRKLSKRSRGSYHAAGTSEEALMVPHIDDDRASSIAATHDGASEISGWEGVMDFSRSPTPVVEKAMDDASLEALVATSHAKISNPDKGSSESPTTVPLPGSRPASIAFEGQDMTTEPLPKTSEANPMPLSGNLPDGGSKVVQVYRTNEWAKHLDGADLPEVEEPRVIKKQVRDNWPQGEQAAPLDLHALQQTPLNAEPSPKGQTASLTPSQSDLGVSKTRSSTFMSKNPFSRRSKQQDAPAKSQPNLHPLTVAKNAERNPSQTSLAEPVSRTASQTSLNGASRGGNAQRPALPKLRSSQSLVPHSRSYRSSGSTPLPTSPLVESPIKEDVESSFPSTRFTPHNSHLMSERDRIITAKPSSTSLLRTSYSNVALDQHPAHRSIEEDGDDIPLTKRKSLLQQKSQASIVPYRSSSGPSGATTPQLPFGTSTPAHKSPYRSSSTPQPMNSRPMPTQRDSTISAWRSSLKPDTTVHLENQNMEARRADLLREKQRQSTNRMEGQIKQGVRASVIDQGMRRGDMMSAHQAAMRKMQGEAKI